MADGTSPAAENLATQDAAATGAATPDAELLVCVTCRRAGAPDAPRPGQALMDALLASPPPEGLRITPTQCLQNCEGGCTVALRGGDARWTYVFGALDPATQAGMLLAGAAQYRDAADGVIPWRRRPEHFKRNCVARIPPLAPGEA